MTHVWLAACLGLTAAVACCALAAWRGSLARRLVALQAMSAITAMLLVAMTYAFDQPALIDLALTLAVLNLPATILFATFAERSL